MPDAAPRARLVRKRKVRLYQGRTALYAWLRAHHARITKLRGTVPCLWAELCLDMTEDGVVDTNGDHPSVDNIRMTWQRLCRDMEVQEPPSKPTGGKFPSRISPDWRPQTVVPPPPIRAPLPGPVSIPSAAPAVTNPTASEKAREGRESLDRAFAKLEADDRRKFRFGG